MTAPLGRPVPTPRQSDAGHRDVRRAWLSLVLLPVSFVAAAFLGDWLLSLQGYHGGDDSIPVSASLWAGGPSLLVLVIPPVATLFFGLRARRKGAARSGTGAVVVGGAAATGLVVLNLLALFTGR
ncbi:hypothetical protein [Streptomyces sp. NPDC007264]|uniref:hypothetical protein n=1 Tax=Streptomyces sp. NPDC007264 TaxID=3364777 RepID=UPI0036DAC796